MRLEAEVHRAAHRQLAAVWARSFIAELMDRATFESNRELPAQIRQLALDHDLMSAFIAFVAVDSSRMTAGEHGTVVPVAVPVPDGVRYDTTVADSGR